MEEKISVLGLDGKEKETIDLPDVFDTPIRLDLIERAVISSEAANKQPQGRDPLAGKRNSAQSWNTGFGVARVPRRKGSGYPDARGAAFAPMCVKGRVTHPPRSEKVLIKCINKKEKHLALLSAISATHRKDLVSKRGHKVQEIAALPIVIDDKFQSVKKTSQVFEIFEKIGLTPELERVKEGRTIRAGKGKRRGRKYKNRKGPLIVVKDNLGVFNAARNIPGVDVINVINLNCSALAPGTRGGRLTIYTQSALNELKKLQVTKL
jgi:large subunit ribosomal protein L4e